MGQMTCPFVPDVCTFVTRRLQKPQGARVRITANTLTMKGTFIMKTRRIIVTMLVTLALGCCAIGLGACATSGTPQDGANGEGGAPLTVAAMKGPTAIGMAHLMQEQDVLSEKGDKPAYEFTVATTADELVPRVAAGEFDIACVPANLAAKLYKQTNGAIRVIGINTLGVLYGVSYDGTVQGLDSLAGRTVYLTGKGSVPGYTVEYLLDKAELSDKVALEYVSEPSEALARLNADRTAVAIVPEPFATASLAKDTELARVLDMTALWDESSAGKEQHGRFVTGVTVARSELIDNDPESLARFMDAWNASVQAGLANPSSIAQTLVDFGILGNVSIADTAVPRCNIVCILHEQMKEDLSGYLQALYEAEPSSIGGELPDDSFYYIG